MPSTEGRAYPVDALLECSPDVKVALAGGITAVDDVFAYDAASATFRLKFTEKGTARGEAEESESTVEFEDVIRPVIFALELELEPVQCWGINFGGALVITHPEEESKRIYLPGARTYDPAGLSGDMHASER